MEESRFPTIELLPKQENQQNVNDDHDHVGNPNMSSSLTSQSQNQSSPRHINSLEAQLQSLRIGPSHANEEALHRDNVINQQTLAAGKSGSGPTHANERLLNEENYTNQMQTLAAENSGIRPSHAYERFLHDGNYTNQRQTLPAENFGIIGHERLLHDRNYANNLQTLAAGNSGIGPSHQSYERLLHGNNIINQQTLQGVGNYGIGPSHQSYESMIYDRNYTNQQTLVGNFGIGPSNNAYERLLLHDGNHANHQQTLAAGNNYSGYSLMMRQRYNNITSLEVLRGMVVSMSKEEEGSEFLVRVLDCKNSAHIEFISIELLDHLHHLMMDRFANRVIQKIFDVLDVDQVTLLFELITNNELQFQIVCEDPPLMNILAYQNICVAVQSMIDNFSTDRQIIVFAGVLKGIAVSLATSRYGSIVLHHFLKFCPPPLSKDILQAMALECTHIARDKTGCSILQRCLSIAALESSLVLVSAISNRVALLAAHQYGNYVVQYVIGLRLPSTNDEIVNRLRGSYFDLSVNKHGSNVVEKLLQFSTQRNVRIIVQEIMRSPRFLDLLQNDYGNYVAQRALECSEGDLYLTLAGIIWEHRTNLCTDQFGRRVLAFMYGGRRF